jgi:hypothetical protein
MLTIPIILYGSIKIFLIESLKKFFKKNKNTSIRFDPCKITLVIFVCVIQSLNKFFDISTKKNINITIAIPTVLAKNLFLLLVNKEYSTIRIINNNIKNTSLAKTHRASIIPEIKLVRFRFINCKFREVIKKKNTM